MATNQRERYFALKMILNIPELRQGLTADDLPDAIDTITDRFKVYRKAWEDHPEFSAAQSDPALSWLPFDDPLFCCVVMVFGHDRGIDGKTESYVVATLTDLASAYQWGRKGFGQLKAIRPVRDSTPILHERLTLVNNSYGGKAKGYYAREALKQMLPSKLRKWVNKGRRAKRQPKYQYLAMPLTINANTPVVKNGTLGEVKDRYDALKASKALPEWYTQHTKAELWADHFCTSEPAAARAIARHIDLVNFYRIVSSEVHPDDVLSMMKNVQLSLF